MKNQEQEMLLKEELSSQFEEICRQQFFAAKDFKNSLYNKLYRQMELVVSDLKSRPGDGRRALLPLRTHGNPQVRLMAANCTLSIDYAGSLATLEALAQLDQFPTAMSSKSMLRALRDGTYVPT
jgi:hypothetical protein